MMANSVFSLSLRRKPWMSVSHTGSMGSSVFTELRLSNFLDSLGTSNPWDPSKMALQRDNGGELTIYRVFSLLL